MLIMVEGEVGVEDLQRSGNAALLALNVPNVSISMTVLKPLVESCSAVARKLPAAQLMRMWREPNRVDAVCIILEQSSNDLTSPWSRFEGCMMST